MGPIPGIRRCRTTMAVVIAPRRFRSAIVILVNAALFLASAAYADVDFIPSVWHAQKTDHSVDEAAHLKVFGEITERDVGEVRRLLPRAKRQARFCLMAGCEQKIPLVVFDSPGGNLIAAMQIGEILRRSMAMTMVASDSTCASACVFAYLGGVSRTASENARIGLHRPYFEQSYFAGLTYDQARARYDELVAKADSYLRKMGARPGLIQEMLSTPSQDITYLTSEQTDYWSIRGDDPGFEEWKRARETQAFGEDWVHYIDCISAGRSECIDPRH